MTATSLKNQKVGWKNTTGAMDDWTKKRLFFVREDEGKEKKRDGGTGRKKGKTNEDSDRPSTTC